MRTRHNNRNRLKYNYLVNLTLKKQQLWQTHNTTQLVEEKAHPPVSF